MPSLHWSSIKQIHVTLKQSPLHIFALVRFISSVAVLVSATTNGILDITVSLIIGPVQFMMCQRLYKANLINGTVSHYGSLESFNF